MDRRLYSIMVSGLFLGALFLQHTMIHQVWFGGILLVLYTAWIIRHLNDQLTKRTGKHISWWILASGYFSVIAIIGCVAYYTTSIPAMLVYVLIAGPLLITPFFTTKNALPIRSTRKAIQRALKPHITITIIGIGTLIALINRFVISHHITTAIRSPWNQISPAILGAFLCALILTAALLYRGREKRIAFIAFLGCFGTVVSFIALAYPLGYGFDPFIHQATESHLATFGTIEPKPFYYIGQYALVLFFHHGFDLPVSFIDTWLVPLLTLTLLPIAWLTTAAQLVKKPRYAFLTLFGLFLIPLEPFLVITPQNLANLWTLLTVLLTVPYLFLDLPLPKYTLALFTATTLLIHPIAGIPIVFYAILLTLTAFPKLPAQPTQWIRRFFIAIGATSLPISFMIQSVQQGHGLTFQHVSLNPIDWIFSLHLDIFWQNRFSPLLDFVYVYGQNAALLIIIISVGAWLTYRKELSDRVRILRDMIIILVINYILLANLIDFSFLIEYERANYANRLLPLILYFLSPLLLLGLAHVSMNLRVRPLSLKLTAIALLCAISTSAIYLSVPREDAYAYSRAFNVSQSDIDAVQQIDEWAKNESYIVLANQSVSAAAIRSIGFRYIGNQFLYPIPTGTEFYQKFLDMNEQPSRQTIEQARVLVQSGCASTECARSPINTVFYVVDSYWWQATQIIEQTKSIADDWRSLNGEVYIFRFNTK